MPRRCRTYRPADRRSRSPASDAAMPTEIRDQLAVERLRSRVVHDCSFVSSHRRARCRWPDRQRARGCIARGRSQRVGRLPRGDLDVGGAERSPRQGHRATTRCGSGAASRRKSQRRSTAIQPRGWRARARTTLPCRRRSPACLREGTVAAPRQRGRRGTDRDAARPRRRAVRRATRPMCVASSGHGRIESSRLVHGRGSAGAAEATPRRRRASDASTASSVRSRSPGSRGSRSPSPGPGIRAGPRSAARSRAREAPQRRRRPPSARR